MWRAHPPSVYLPGTKNDNHVSSHLHDAMCHFSLWTRLDKVCQIESPSVMCLRAVKRCANRQHSATQRTMSTNLHCTHTSLSQHFYLLSHRRRQDDVSHDEARERSTCRRQMSCFGMMSHPFTCVPGCRHRRGVCVAH